MNTIIKSAIFAAVIMFGGIYAVDALYNKSNTGAEFANIEPAAGEKTDAAFGGIQQGMNAVATDAKAEAAGEVVNDAANTAKTAIEQNITDAEAKAEAEAEVNQIATDAQKNIQDRNEATLNTVQEETDLMAEEAQDAAKEMISKTEEAIDNAAETEPAAGAAGTQAE